jgi:hypothetical protein
MKRNLLMIGALAFVGSTAFAQSNINDYPKLDSKVVTIDVTDLHKIPSGDILPGNSGAAGGGPCTTFSDGPYIDLNGAGGAPCADTSGACTLTDAGFGTIGIYGSEAYALDGCQMGFDYMFDMCTGGLNPGAWIPEITILAPDGTTVDANNAASSASGATHADQCSIEWTASQDGEYTIIINEMGTSFGNAPNQADCTTLYAVDNGNPTVTCGTNPAPCPPCAAGVLSTAGVPASVCPWVTFTLATDGTEGGAGGAGIFFNPGAGATGGPGGAFTLLGATFPSTQNDDLAGVLSSNSLSPLRGSWTMYSVGLDGADAICSVSTDSVTVEFLQENDPSCVNGISEEAMALSVYPNPSNGTVIIEMNGDNTPTIINVTDMMGRVVYTETARPGMNYRTSLDLNVVNGTYTLNIVSSEAVVTRKLQIRK